MRPLRSGQTELVEGDGSEDGKGNDGQHEETVDNEESGTANGSEVVPREREVLETQTEENKSILNTFTKASASDHRGRAMPVPSSR